MTIHQTRTTPSRRVPPAAQQPGPVTLAIRGVRPNSLPSWEMREQQIEDERRALRELRERIASRIEADLAILDALDSDSDLEADYGTCERLGAQIVTIGRSTDDEPSDSGLGDLDGALEQRGNGPFHDTVFA